MSDAIQWRAEPDRFANDALGVTPWARQRDIFHTVATRSHVAVRSGHKIGKSNAAAALALWWAVTQPGARVVLTAPANHQIENILWPELRLMYSGARLPLGGRLFDDPRKGIRFGDKWGIFGLTTDKPERIAGLSGGKLLFIVDEASGYPEDLFQAIFGNLGGGGKVVLFGNPTQASGTFFNAFHGKRDNWATIHVDSRETPNFHGHRIPGLATPEWVEWAKKEWGEDSPLFDVRVAGNFPTGASNAVVPLSLIERAPMVWAESDDDGPLELGVDVARFGDDDSVIVARRKNRVLCIEAVHGYDTVQVVGKVLEVIREHRHPGERPVARVDVTGGHGAGPADLLRSAHDAEVDVVDMNSSERAYSEHEYMNLRAEMAFGVTAWLKAGGAYPADSKLDGELAAPQYDFDSKGRRRVESKTEIKKRLGRSPDRGDALGLAVYEHTITTYTGDAGGVTEYVSPLAQF